MLLSFGFYHLQCFTMSIGFHLNNCRNQWPFLNFYSIAVGNHSKQQTAISRFCNASHMGAPLRVLDQVRSEEQHHVWFRPAPNRRGIGLWMLRFRFCIWGFSLPDPRSVPATGFPADATNEAGSTPDLPVPLHRCAFMAQEFADILRCSGCLVMFSDFNLRVSWVAIFGIPNTSIDCV